MLNVAADEALVGGFEEKGHEVLSEIKAIIDQQHQGAISQVIVESTARAGEALTGCGGANRFAFALGFELEESLLELWQQVLKGVQVHTGDGQKELGPAGEFGIKVHEIARRQTLPCQFLLRNRFNMICVYPFALVSCLQGLRIGILNLLVFFHFC